MDDYTAFGYRGCSPAARPACDDHVDISLLVPVDHTALPAARSGHWDGPVYAPCVTESVCALQTPHAWDTEEKPLGAGSEAQHAVEPYPESEPGPEPEPCLEPELLAEPEFSEEPELCREPEFRPEPGRRSATASQRPHGRRHHRRHRAGRSAVFTIAMPSAAVMSVAAAAVAGVAVSHGSARPSAANATGRVPNRLDPRHSGTGRDARDLTARASRAQQRLDLQERAEAQRRRAAQEAAQEAARREELRPKFALPVTQRGLSAYFGQVGLNWMSFHTGIDFPVNVGTPVRAATDGKVSTDWSPAYGNMVKVTAPDGTQTWYCHLSSVRVRSGTVQAGEVIAYSGNTGNTTGPHLHFEVRPDGGEPVDPLSWLLNHDLDPR